MHFVSQNNCCLYWSIACRECDWLQNILSQPKVWIKCLISNEWYTYGVRERENGREKWTNELNENIFKQCGATMLTPLCWMAWKTLGHFGTCKIVCAVQYWNSTASSCKRLCKEWECANNWKYLQQRMVFAHLHSLSRIENLLTF